MLGGIGGKRRRGWQRMRWLDGITTRWMWVSVNSGSWWWTGRPGVLQFMGSQRVGHDWATDLIWSDIYILSKQNLILCIIWHICNKMMQKVKKVKSREIIPSTSKSKKAKIIFLIFDNLKLGPRTLS